MVSHARIKFGIFDWIDRDRLPIDELYEQRLKLIEAGDQNGFYCYHVAEHHGSPLNMTPSPNLFLAAAAQRTERIRLGTLVYVLPAYNPLRLAEEICMLDHLTRGRLDVGVGRGISPIELSFFNIGAADAREMFRESLEAVVGALATGKLSYAGRYFSFRNVELQIEPFQRPYPPLWYPTNSTESMEWLAREGFHTVVHYQSMPVIRDLFGLYRRVWQEHQSNRQRLNGHVTNPLYGIQRGKKRKRRLRTLIATAVIFNRAAAITNERTISMTSRRAAPKVSILPDRPTAYANR